MHNHMHRQKIYQGSHIAEQHLCNKPWLKALWIPCDFGTEDPQMLLMQQKGLIFFQHADHKKKRTNPSGRESVFSMGFGAFSSAKHQPVTEKYQIVGFLPLTFASCSDCKDAIAQKKARENSAMFDKASYLSCSDLHEHVSFLRTIVSPKMAAGKKINCSVSCILAKQPMVIQRTVAPLTGQVLRVKVHRFFGLLIPSMTTCGSFSLCVFIRPLIENRWTPNNFLHICRKVIELPN